MPTTSFIARRAALALALGALASQGACGGDAIVVEGLHGRALAALAVDDAGAPSLAGPAGPAEAVEDAAEAAGLFWSSDPDELQVYRPTAVHLKVDAFPRGRETASCRWVFGDGTPASDGCSTSHTFLSGQADEQVTLTLTDGDWTLESTRVIPLERLPVTTLTPGAGADQAGAGGLPPKPRAGPSAGRVLFLADSAGTPDPEPVVASLMERLAPDLVVHVGGIVPAGGGDDAWDRARDRIARVVTGAGAEMAWAMAPGDVAAGGRVRRPELTLLDGGDYPVRYAFSFKGAFFLVVAGDPERGLSEENLAWMRRRLEEAQVYESRVVVSYLPLHKFADDGAGALNMKLQVYELLLRARVTAFVSAGHRVYFKGRYGALSVVSVGALADAGGKLSGTAFSQQGSVAVMDLASGVPDRVFAVEGPGWDAPLDERYLPETVEVYTR